MNGLARAWERRHAIVAKAPLASLVALTVLASLVFAAFPGIDLAISRLFYEPGEKFPLSRMDVLRDLRAIGGDLPVIIAVVVAIALALKLAYPSRASLLPPRFALYYLSLFVIGPVLIVNGVLKALWGRPRPAQVVDFGGPWTFTEAWAMGGQCLRNCSFVSGEAAAAACLIPLALFVPRAWRGEVAFLIGLLAAVISVNRIAFGAHFLSDVVIAWGLMAILALGLRHIFLVSHAPLFSNEALESRLTLIGLRLHGTLARMRGHVARWIERQRVPRSGVTQA